MRNPLLILAACALLPGTGVAQGAGDALFGTDQVIDIQLSFAMPGYLDSLLAYYAEGLERQLPASLVITDNTGTYTYGQVGVRYKGNSSYGLPAKKSMKIDFNEYVAGQRYHGLKKLNLNNGFKDPTFLREKLFFDFSRELGVLAPRAVFGNVRFNGDLMGFYGVVEQVDGEYLDRWIDDQDGNLFKAGDNFGPGGSTAADLAWYGPGQAAYEARYELKTNEDANDWSDLIALIDAINNSADDQAEPQLAALADLDPLLRSLAIDNLFSNLDSYINSARNWYLYHSAGTGIWHWIKWDANEAFGRYPGGVPDLLHLPPGYTAPNRPLMARIMEVPALYQRYMMQYCAAYDAFSNALLDPRIDALAALIQPHVFTDPHKQYTNAQFTANLDTDISGGGPGGQLIYGLKPFISNRRQYLAGVLGCATSGVAEEELRTAIFAPNPCSGAVRADLPAGARVQAVEVRDCRGAAVPVPLVDGALDFTARPAGLYAVRMVVDGQVVMGRIVRE